MALSANKIVETKLPDFLQLQVITGAIHIYKGALLNYSASDPGYVKLGSDTLSEIFAGVSMDELDLSSALNTAHGTFQVNVMPKGCMKLVKMTITDNITIADEGVKVYVNGDDAVKKSVTNTTGGLVGIIKQFVSTNVAWVQMLGN